MSYKVYTNVIKMITKPEYRNMELENNKILDKNKFNSDVDINGHVSLKCKKKDSKIFDTIFYILSEKSNVVRSVVEFKKIMGKVAKIIPAVINVYIINSKEMSQQVYKLISNKFSKYKIFVLKYNIFQLEIPKHVISNKHEILTSKEVNDLIDDLSIVSIDKLPQIYMVDSMCVWIGAEVGDIIRVTRTEQGGVSINYRFVVGPVNINYSSSSG